MASTISAARLALYNLLTAEEALAGTQVTFGPPDAHEEQEVVALMGVETPDEDPATIGGSRPRAETFVLVVAVKVHGPEDDAPTVDARGWALLDVVRSVVYANQTLTDSLSPPGWARVASQTSDAVVPAEGGGWVFFGQVRVLCRARIS